MALTAISNQPPEPPLTLARVIETLGDEVEHARKVLTEATNTADMLLGGTPRLAEATPKDAPDPPNMLERLRMRQQTLFTLHGQINDQITRIRNALV